MTLLDKLPRERWTERNPDNWTMLHYACRGDNTAAAVALLAHGMDIGAQTKLGWLVTHHAAFSAQARTLELLCAAGANLTLRDRDAGVTPLEVALFRLPLSGDCARVLLANGVRLSTVREEERSFIIPELEAFERGVLRCRAGVVALLRVKRASKVSGHLAHWDKFLLGFIAIHVWATRYASEWAK